ncbi:MAG: DEAD/DEAH box helicase [Rickettsiales bacterium]|nr:DEAD/DEAH box helicase [Rickettsiales bacterium]
MSNFQTLNLHQNILTTLEKKGYTTPTPIQAQSIPHLLEGKDLLGIAQTGTGKTAAFSLPILHRLFENKHQVNSNQIRALILTPTRELALQIGENIEVYGKGLGLKHAVIFGGVNEFHQIKALKTGLDIVIATPGRFLDLANQGHVRFSQIEVFVLDEADRMLDMGFINDVKKIISKLPPKRQNLLFSATMPDAISGLAHSILHQPVKVEITPQSTTVERINQKVYLVDKSNKPALLLDVLTKPDVVAALVFSKTKHGANKVVTHLEKYGVQVSAIHGNKSQTAREKALNDFRSGKIKVLIATDIAARGIDVPNISHVVNYDIPVDPESYVHRIGRTARAGREGIAISFCDFSENLLLRAVEKAIRMKIPVDDSHPFHGKAATHDPSEGKLLSRGTAGNRFHKKTETGENSDRRKPDNRPERDYSRSSSSNSRFSRSDRNQSRFSKEERDYSKPSSSNSRFSRSDRNQSRSSKEERDYSRSSSSDSRFSKTDRNHSRSSKEERDYSKPSSSNSRFSRSDRNHSKFSKSERDYSSSSSPYSSDRNEKNKRFSKDKRSNGIRFFSDNILSEGSKSLAKKVLHKFGFKKFGKQNISSDDSTQGNDFSKPRSRNQSGNFSKDRNGKSRSSSSHRKPFNKNRKQSY